MLDHDLPGRRWAKPLTPLPPPVPFASQAPGSGYTLAGLDRTQRARTSSEREDERDRMGGGLTVRWCEHRVTAVCRWFTDCIAKVGGRAGTSSLGFSANVGPRHWRRQARCCGRPRTLQTPPGWAWKPGLVFSGQTWQGDEGIVLAAVALFCLPRKFEIVKMKSKSFATSSSAKSSGSPSVTWWG